MFNRYFQQELNNLKDLGAEFAKNHPAVAPMLSGLSTDPDVERLLEGVAFLTALLRQKLDDDFPEIIHELFQLIWPHYLRPLPATSIVAFRPKTSLKQAIRVPKGVQLSSEPVEGTPCQFRTCYDVTVHPIAIEDAFLEDKPGHPPAVCIRFKLQDLQVGEFQPDALRLHLSGEASQTANLYLLLMRHLRQIVITSQGAGESAVLEPACLKPVGFDDDHGLIPYPGQSYPGYRIIQEYFMLPAKFMFFDLVGWERWTHRGEGDLFSVRFELSSLGDIPCRVRKNSFTLAATPVINLFSHDANPIRLDHRKSDYLVSPTGFNGKNYQVYSVDKVTGFVQGTAQERTYDPFELFSPDPDANPTYHVHIRRSPVRPGCDSHLSVAYPPNAGTPQIETLSIKLQCTNGFLPEALQVGDIRHPTSSTPEFVDFQNIQPTTSNILPPVGENLLWKLLSHLCLNYRTLVSADNLNALLSLYNFEENRDRPAFLANQKRLDSIQKVQSSPTDRLVDRVIMRGRGIYLELRQDHFAGPGDLFLFGAVIDHFLGGYASINTFTQLTVKEVLKGEVYQWPARIGNQPLI